MATVEVMPNDEADPLVPESDSPVENARRQVAAVECALVVQRGRIEAKRSRGESTAVSEVSLAKLQAALVGAYMRLAGELRKVRR